MKPIQLNCTKVIIDNELYLKVNSPLINKSIIYHSTEPEFTVECTEKKELRTLDQNRFYFGAIVRGGMKIMRELTGDSWADAEVHSFNMEHVFGVRPQLITKGNFQFTVFGVTLADLESNFRKLDWDVSLLAGVKPKSSKFDKHLFAALIELCIRYYAENFQYHFYETDKGHIFSKELYGPAH